MDKSEEKKDSQERSEEYSEETKHALKYGRFSDIPEDELTPLEKIFRQMPKPPEFDNSKILENLKTKFQGENNEK